MYFRGHGAQCRLDYSGLSSGEEKHGVAPHLIYLPERPFREEEFLADVKELYDRLGGVVVVASEGLKDESGKPVVPPISRQAVPSTTETWELIWQSW